MDFWSTAWCLRCLLSAVLLWLHFMWFVYVSHTTVRKTNPWLFVISFFSKNAQKWCDGFTRFVPKLCSCFLCQLAFVLGSHPCRGTKVQKLEAEDCARKAAQHMLGRLGAANSRELQELSFFSFSSICGAGRRSERSESGSSAVTLTGCSSPCGTWWAAWGWAGVCLARLEGFTSAWNHGETASPCWWWALTFLECL